MQPPWSVELPVSGLAVVALLDILPLAILRLSALAKPESIKGRHGVVPSELLYWPLGVRGWWAWCKKRQREVERPLGCFSGRLPG